MERHRVAVMVSAFFLSALVLISCGGAKPKPTAESKATYAGVTLGRSGPVKGVVEADTVFLTSDEAVAAQVTFENLREEIEVRWDWIAPVEKQYVSASRKVGPGAGLYYPKAAAIHAINVDGEPASGMPGLWTVEVYVDGAMKDAKKFPLEPGLASLKSPRVPADPAKWALVVGIEKYLHLPPVDFASSDARKAANYFVNVLGVPEKNLILLENEKATRSAVTGRLKDYLPHNVGAGGILYVFFAGHGMPDVGTGEPYLMMFDSEMNPDELRKAVEEPARRNGWQLEPGLVDLLLHDIGAEGDRSPEPGALPLLSHALLETWHRRSGRMLTLAGYAESGAIRGAITKTAETVFARLTSEEQSSARNIFLRLTELGEGMQETRRRVQLRELLQPPGIDALPARTTETVLKMLSDARLIITSESTAEVAHEALIREWHRLHEWLAENREGLRLHRRITEAAREWENQGRDPELVHRGTRLAQALECADSHYPGDLNLLEREFLRTSTGHRFRRCS